MRYLVEVLLRVLLVASATIGAVSAEETTAYDLRTAEFTVPADWEITYSSRDQEYDFVSPDGRFELWARWYFQDEPLLGFDDIVRHEKRQLAGQEALFRHIESGGQRSLTVAFLEKDAEGEIFLLQLHSSSASLADHEAMLESLLAGLTLDGKPAQSAAAPAPAANAGTKQAGGAMYHDPNGAFALPLPDGWTAQSTVSKGLSQAVLATPSRDAMLLAVVARPERGMTAAEVLDEQMGVLYRDSLVVKSIEDERYPDIAGTTVHAIETIAKVYAINGVAMPYPRGRVWIYRSNEEAAGRMPFLLISIRPEKAPQALTEMLEQTALGFTFDNVASAPKDTTSQVTEIPSVAVKGQVAPPTIPGLIFDGQSIDGVVPFAFNTVTFEEYAKLVDNAISFGFPKDHNWAKLGFATPAAVVNMPQRGSDKVQRITAILDADKSNGISFALVPVTGVQEDPYEVHDLRLQFSTGGDGNAKLELATKEPRQSAKAYFHWPEGETVLHLLLRPDQVVEVRDGSGTQLAEIAITADFSGREWALQTYLQVPHKNGAGSLVLKRLSVDTIPFQPSPKVDVIAKGAESTVIFDGYALGRMWEPVSRYEGEVSRFMKMSDGALRIGWTAEEKGTWTGVSTPEAALWLDRFTGDAEARIDLALDGAGSKDFEIALQSSYSLPGNLSGNNSYVLRLTQLGDGTFSALSALRSKETHGLEAIGLPAIPDRITLVLTPGGVRVEGAGMPEGVLPFAEVQDGTGMRIAIHAMRTAALDGALVLRGIRVSRRPGEYPQPPVPSAGLDPLPQEVFFDARPDESWEGRSTGKADFTALATQHSDGLSLARRSPVPDWSRIAFVGSKVVADLDYRADTTPYELTLKLDPEQGLGTRIYLHANPDRFADSARSILTLRELPDGPEAGGLEVLLHTAHFSYQHWRRVLPAAYWRDEWDGTVRLRLGPDWIAVALGDDWLMRGHRQGREFMMALSPGGAGNSDGGKVTLHRITGGWLTPDGLSGTERMRLSDTKDFDADAFLNLLATETGVSPE